MLIISVNLTLTHSLKIVAETFQLKSFMNKKKKRLRAPTVSLQDKPFLLNTPKNTNNNNDTPSNKKHNHNHNHMMIRSSSSSLLNRNNLTYTPMTRKLLQKQQQFIQNKYQPIIPSISSSASTLCSYIQPFLQQEPKPMTKPIEIKVTQNNNKNNKHIAVPRKKKRKFAEIEMEGMSI